MVCAGICPDAMVGHQSKLKGPEDFRLVGDPSALVPGIVMFWCGSSLIIRRFRDIGLWPISCLIVFLAIIGLDEFVLARVPALVRSIDADGTPATFFHQPLFGVTFLMLCWLPTDYVATKKLFKRSGSNK